MYKVLAIDDSPTMHRLFKMIFSEENGYVLFSAYNGEEGFDKLRENEPDIILLDFVMPKLNGFQFAKMIREDMKKDIPILLITSKADKVGDRFINKFTNIDCIAKPFQAEDLERKVKEMLEVKGIEVDSITDTSDTKEEVENIETEHADNTVGVISAKVEAMVLPALRALIEKALKFETGYMISDVKGDFIDLDKLVDLANKFEGELIFFNNDTDIHLYIQNGFIIHAFRGSDKIKDIFELYQDVCGVCLLEVDSLSELYEQLRNLGFADQFLRKHYEYYLNSIIYEILNNDFRYYFDEIDIPENMLSRFRFDCSKLKESYSLYLEERAEINKIVYDGALIPRQVAADLSSLTDFEKKIYELCNGERTVEKILSFFGNNSNIAKNTIGALILTGFLTI
ncbi:response regulator [Deferribacter thermophilus]|uniref:response regulator n=1 Tax=Deferribacter thermophilus TaxID=53573 RepID=UPI003C25C0CD